MKNAEERFGADYDRAVAALTDAAWDQDLLDVGYGFVDSPFGRLLVAVTSRGVVRVEYPNGGIEEQLEALAAEVSPRLMESPRLTEALRRELDEYFAGKRQVFTVPADLRFLRGFGRRVLEETAGIPFGAVATYREVATRAGSPRASRAAGNALAANPVPIVVPCHRVVRSDGSIGEYLGGTAAKVALLQLEAAA